MWPCITLHSHYQYAHQYFSFEISTKRPRLKLNCTNFEESWVQIFILISSHFRRINSAWLWETLEVMAIWSWSYFIAAVQRENLAHDDIGRAHSIAIIEFCFLSTRLGPWMSLLFYNNNIIPLKHQNTLQCRLKYAVEFLFPNFFWKYLLSVRGWYQVPEARSSKCCVESRSCQNSIFYLSPLGIQIPNKGMKTVSIFLSIDIIFCVNSIKLSKYMCLQHVLRGYFQTYFGNF